MQRNRYKFFLISVVDAALHCSVHSVVKSYENARPFKSHPQRVECVEIAQCLLSIQEILIDG